MFIDCPTTMASPVVRCANCARTVRSTKAGSARAPCPRTRRGTAAPTVDGRSYPAFPRPAKLLELEAIAGVSSNKATWLRGIAQAALEGRLDTEMLRALPHDDALAALQELPGIGPWTAEAIRLRGCGMVDELPSSDEISPRAVAALYGREPLDARAFERLADAWRPYRMWAVVLLRFSSNRETPIEP